MLIENPLIKIKTVIVKKKFIPKALESKVPIRVFQMLTKYLSGVYSGSRYFKY